MTGWTRTHDAVRIEGSLGEGEPRRLEWPVPRVQGASTTVVHDSRGALVLEQRWQTPGLAQGLLWSMLDHPMLPVETTLRALGAHGATPLAHSAAYVTCYGSRPGAAGVLCLAFDGKASFVSLVDVGQPRVEPVARFRGPVWSVLHGEANLLVFADGQQVRLLLPRERLLHEVLVPERAACTTAASERGALALLCQGEAGPNAFVYDLAAVRHEKR